MSFCRRLLTIAVAPCLAAAAGGASLPGRPLVETTASSIDNSGGLYSLDGWGGVHPVGAAPTVSGTAYWRGWDIARGIVTRPDHRSGYVLDGWGGVHPFGGAPAVAGGAYWQGWDIARGIALTPAGDGGWVLDGWGGIHSFGGAPAVSASAYWQGWDIARGIVSDTTGRGGWVLDGWGGLHPFGDAPGLATTGYWSGWDIARALTLNPSGAGGYVLDGWGGLHPFGSAPPASGTYWQGWDIARGVVAWTGASGSQTGGWVVDGWGAVHAYGDAPAETATATWPGWDIVRGLGGTNSGARAVAAHPHLLVVMLENRGYAATLGDCSADPYLCSLASAYASDTNWYGITHPSLPNYLAADSGSTQGCSSDACTGPYAAPDLGGQLSAAAIPWTAYMESMPAPCYGGVSYGEYALKHNPFQFFSDNRGACHDLPYPGAAGLLGALDAASPPDFVWITPNLADDMHDGSVQQGDAWLKANIGPVLSSPWFTQQPATVVITMDEGVSGAAGGQVPMVVVSSAARGHGAVGGYGNHYGLLRSIESVFGLPLLGGAASGANGDLSALFGH